ncbi:VWA domain-containing protein [Streptomyces sp. NPDC048484]|uniref:VWA domain-containing protein n=1 Tax=Streptomyces sp. NPDC048484 TaxID=3155146 RepID=UPI0034459AAE
MAAEEALVPKRAGKPGKGRFAASLAVRMSGAKRHAPRVVLALPGGDRWPFESGEIAGMARRAATLGEFLAPGAGVEPWIYTARIHRLPELRLANAAEWIEDWAVVPPTSLLTRDAPPDNQLLANAKRYGLFDSRGTAEAVKAITAGLPKGGVPTLVLFHVWAPSSDDTSLADQLEAASGANVFWQFLGDPDLTHVLRKLDALRAQAPHITNVSLFRGWNIPEGIPEYFLFRGALKPFVRWCRQPKN